MKTMKISSPVIGQVSYSGIGMMTNAVSRLRKMKQDKQTMQAIAWFEEMIEAAKDENNVSWINTKYIDEDEV